MQYAGLFLFADAMWLLVALAAAARADFEARRSGGEPGGVSILGYVTVPPAFFTAVAYAVDRVREPIGLWVVAGVHAFLGIVAVAYVVRTRTALGRDDPEGP